MDGRTFVVETGEKGKSGEKRIPFNFKDGNFRFRGM